jgi:hypothetical protein
MSSADIFWLASGGLITLLVAIATGYWIAQEELARIAAAATAERGTPEARQDGSATPQAPDRS